MIKPAGQYDKVLSVHIFFRCPEQLSKSSFLSVGWSIRRLVIFLKKWPLEYQKEIISYLLTYLWDSIDICDSCGSWNSSDSSESSDNSDNKKTIVTVVTVVTIVTTTKKNFFHQKTFFHQFFSPSHFFSYCKTFFTKKKSNCDETQKLKIWWNSKTKIVMKLKNSSCDETKNSNCNETQKSKLWGNSKTEIVRKLRNWNGEKIQNSNCDETQKTQIVMKIKKINL